MVLFVFITLIILSKRNTTIPQNPFPFYQRAFYNFFQIVDHFLSRKVTRTLFGRLRHFIFQKSVKTLENKGEGTLFPIDIRENLSIEEFKSYYVSKGIPVILRGVAKSWNCVREWDLDYLKEKHGEDEVPIFDSADFSKGKQLITLNELIDRIKQGDKESYFRFYNLMERHPEHLRDFNLKWLKQRKHKRTYFESFQVFIGAKGSKTEIHNAHIANLFTQAYGTKEWVLYPNFNIPFIDPASTLNGIFRNAAQRGKDGKSYNPFFPDDESFPYFKYLDGYKGQLEPGDILYNPPFMWHAVHNATNSIGIGYRWINTWHSLRSSPVYYILDLLAFRPSYFKSIKMVRKNANDQFDYYFDLVKKLEMKRKKNEA